jgi:hypothetical protein
VGDLVPTVFGGISPIQWIGHYRFKRSNPTKEGSSRCPRLINI